LHYKKKKRKRKRRRRRRSRTKSLSHPSWPPVVTNRYDITNNREDTTERNRKRN